MNFSKIKLITPICRNGLLKQCFTLLVFLLFFGVVSGQIANPPIKGTAEGQTLLLGIPFSGKTFNDRKSLGDAARGACRKGVRPNATNSTRE